MSRGWLAVVSAEHVAIGVQRGFAQVNHGKRSPLAKMAAGDALVYYSPTTVRGVSDGCRSFTAIGTLPDDEIWQADEGSFKPFRRRVDYLPGNHVPVNDLRDRLALAADARWGYQLRRGFLELDPADVHIIRTAMTAQK
ncbi:EVE domain-containing protein [Brevibacterium sp. CSND-B09]|uniref:EVE domain-containing protein n=1 Tax=Brevibacterium sp. CSND-B09 TaxID=3462571 RepID=UPI00406A26F9